MQGSWADASCWAARKRGRRVRKNSFLFSKHIFKSKFKSNSNIVSNILFKMRTFGRFPKLNFCKLLKILYFPILFFFLFFYFKAVFNLFPKAIQTIFNLDSNYSSNKSNAPACMHYTVATPYDEF